MNYLHSCIMLNKILTSAFSLSFLVRLPSSFRRSLTLSRVFSSSLLYFQKERCFNMCHAANQSCNTFLKELEHFDHGFW